MKITKILSLIAFLLCFSSIATAVGYSIPNNEIHYTTIDGNIVTPYKTNGFGANIVSNTYENGQGVITFDEPVTSIGDNAFRSCYSLTSIAISESVTTIGNSAFQQCISLTSIIIGNSVTGIDNSAFRNCISLVSITIPNKITSIRSSTFNGCSSLTSITIPNSVTSIEDYAFYGCSSLSSITLQNNVTNIGIQAFYACSSLTSITIPESVTSIGSGAFDGCSSLTSISIPESVTTIENYAFSDCTSLTSITIPNSVTSIGNEAFESCTSLTSITLPNSVISIGDAALRYCTSLTSISIPSSVTSIGKNAFRFCKSLSSITIPNSVTSIGNDAFNDCVFVGHDNFINYSSLNAEENKYWGAAFADKEINGLLIIYDNIMACRSYVTSITIPNNITSIGRDAFYNCSSLTSITIPNGVTSIGDLAFHGCSSLSSITIPNSIKSIGYGIFSGCYNLSSIVVESGNTTYDSRNNCNAIIYSSTGKLVAGCKNTIIPDDVTTIENKAFQGCSSLTSIIIPNSVTSIGERAFHGCSSLISITIPEGVTSIRNYTFNGCSSLTAITIPESVTSIEFLAFLGCSSLTSITIPESVTSIGESAFDGCSSLSSIIIPNSVISIEYGAFHGCSSLTSISIPKSVTKIGSSAFYGCSSLSSITIPNSVINVEQHAFGGCSSLTSITIGSGVTSIGYRAFYNHLDTINCHAIIPPSLYNSEVFYNYDAALYVPCEALEAYKADAIWGKFSNIQCIEEEHDNKIRYTSTDGNIVTPYDTTAFGANIISNTYENGEGIITFDGIVTKIGENAFEDCENLLSIILHDSIVTIDAYAFANCSQLSNIKLGNSLRSIGTEAFTGVAIDTLILPEGIDSISSNAFSSCANLKVVSIPSSLRYAPAGSSGESVFAGCSSIDSIYWNAHKCPNNVFHSSDTYSSSIRSIEFGDSIQFIHANFCEEFTELSTIVYPSTLRSIGESAFSGCAKLSSSLILDSIATIDAYAFANCSQLSNIKLGNSLRSIGTEAFTGVAIDTLILPEGIDSISSNAFSSCANLKVVSIPSSLRYAPWGSGGESVFAGCSSIDSVYWNAHKCSNNVFHSSDTYSSSIRSIEFGDSILFIPANFCEEFTELSTIVYPSTLRSIGESAFSGCEKLSSLLVLDSIVTIDAYAFANCSQLSNIKLGNSLRSIGTEAFTGVAIDTLILPEGIDSISSNAFSSCANLKVVSIPSSLRYAPWGSGGESVFAGCSSIDSIYWNAHKCPNNVFHSSDPYSSSIRSIEFGDSIQHIFSEFCMDFTALTNVILPISLQSISDAAFSGCDNLDTIYCYATTPPELYDEYVFSNYNATLYIPCEALDAYKSDAIWGKFSNIQCLDAPVPSDPCEDIIELDWRNGIRLSQLNTGWYKLYVGDIHAYQSGITTRFINDMVCPVIINRSYYANCEDREPIIEGSIMYELGETQQTMSYADFSSIVAPHIEYLYLNIASIVEDCEKDTIIENITDWVCDGSTYKDILGEEHLISSLIPDTHTWSQTIETSTTITIYNYTIIPIVRPVIMTNELLATIPGATPVLVAGEEVDVTGTLEAIKNYYYTNDTEAIADVDSVAWTAGADITLACDAESHTMILELIAGCGFISHAELVFEVIPVTVTTTTETAIICEGETYQWQGISCSETGNYSFEVTNEVGCVVEIKTLQLTVIPAEVVTTADTTTICEGESYTWAVNGITYENLAAGIYSYADTIEGNCSRVITTLTLIVNASITKDIDITTCDSYDWNGQTYTQSGEYVYITIAANGCDSIVTLHLTISPTLTAEETITACDSYEWNGQTYTQSGEYTYTTVAANGCDSIVTLHLTISQSVVAPTEYATICHGETSTWNGLTYSTEGEYSIVLSSANGCDSVATLHLTILPEAIIMEESASINEEHLPYLWRGQQCYDAGKYIDNEPFTNYPYCDSVIYVLNLTVEAPNKCGDNLYWHYSNNTLSITGSGAMYDNPDLLSYRNQPWYPARVDNVVLPNTITHIGNVAFADCANLTNIVIPSSVTSIGDGAFSWTGLQSVTIPASVTNLGEQVFETCNNLHTILYEGTPNSISNQTVHPFIGCVHLDTIITPAALWHCTTADPMLEARYGVPHKARYIEVTDGELTKQAMKYIAKNSSTVEVLDLSAATNTTLPLGALLNNYRLSTLYLPDQIEVIPEMLAEGCHSLLEILIPATVTEIGNYAFAGCTNVWRMTVEAVLPPKVYDKTFDGIDRSISLIVPAGSEELYRQAEYWKEFFIEHTNNQSPKSNCQKILHEDHILILREGKVYTTMGQLVK